MITLATLNGKDIGAPMQMLNRHFLITGSTGTGKTRTVQKLIEECSRAGIPSFVADVKDDLSGIAAPGGQDARAVSRMAELGREFVPEKFPVEFWDMNGMRGAPIKTSVQEMGSELVSRALGLNETQQGVVTIAFQKAEDDREWDMTLDDLRYNLDGLMDDQETIGRRYGHVTSSSVRTVLRQLMTLECQGGASLFGEPRFDLMDLMRTVDGKGVVNILAASKLIENPKLYSTFMLWILTELFRVLPEIGDVSKPKMMFVIDEAHLLFRDASKALLQQIERMVKLVRSKGVSVVMVSQSPSDIPDTVLAQLGNRIQHCLRAYTPKDQRMVKAAAMAFRENRGVDVKGEITTLGVGEAFISMLDDKGVPAKVEKVLIIPPCAQIGPIAAVEREVIVKLSDLHKKYPLGDVANSGAFINRMRRERGLPELQDNGSYAEGDYHKYVPREPIDLPKAPRISRWTYLLQAIGWFSVVVGLMITANVIF